MCRRWIYDMRLHERLSKRRLYYRLYDSVVVYKSRIIGYVRVVWIIIVCVSTQHSY